LRKEKRKKKKIENYFVSLVVVKISEDLDLARFTPNWLWPLW